MHVLTGDEAMFEVRHDRDQRAGRITVVVGHLPCFWSAYVDPVREVTTTAAVEAMIGTPPSGVLLKTTGAFDDGCRAGARSRRRVRLPRPGRRTAHDGRRRDAGVRPRGDADRLSFDLPGGAPRPAGDASLVFLLPGIGESLRVSESVAGVTGTRVTLDLREAWVHCGRCVLRSGLWQEKAAAGDGTFAGFLAEHTLAIPDRRGNRRADTFRNLVTCAEVSLAALVPGRDDVLHLGGTAYVSDDPALLSTMALKDRPPHAALVVHVDRAEVRPNEAVRAARLWDRSAHADPSRAPDLTAVAARHLADNEATTAVTRLAARGLAASRGLGRRAVDAGYRKGLRDEGY